MDFLVKHQTLLFRIVGALLFVVSFVVMFWSTPKQGLTQNDRAAANVARMEARMAGSMGSAQKEKPKNSPFMKSYKDTQAQQLRYLLIVFMIVGAGFLGYSFIKKKGD